MRISEQRPNECSNRRLLEQTDERWRTDHTVLHNRSRDLQVPVGGAHPEKVFESLEHYTVVSSLEFKSRRGVILARVVQQPRRQNSRESVWVDNKPR